MSNRFAVIRGTSVLTTIVAPDFANELEFARWTADMTTRLQAGPFPGCSLQMLGASEQWVSAGDSVAGGVFTKGAAPPRTPLDLDSDAAIAEIRGIRLRDMTAAQTKRLLAIICQRIGIDIVP